jgi:predicted dehydrogenase
MPLIQQLEYQQRVSLTIVCDIDTTKKQMLEKRFGIQSFTDDSRKVVESGQVDLVMVLTSMLEHAEITSAALHAGKHVLVEKPTTTTLEEAADLVALAGKSDGHLLCAPHIMLSPTYQAIWARVRRGDIGKVLSARARYGWSGPWWGEWFYRPGGGALFDLGVYNIVSLTGLLGPVKRVMAMTGVAIPSRSVSGKKIQVASEDNAHVLLDFGEAVYAVVTTGFTMQKYRSPAIELYGWDGTIQMMGDDWDPDGYELWQNEKGAWQIFAEVQPDWPWTDGLRHLVDCIQNGAKPLMTPQQAYHVIEIILKAQESGRDGQAKILKSEFERPVFDIEKSLADDDAHLVHDRTH